ncbi:hypothetical protein GGP44_000184 [Salinibacter ruber]|nr:hypothetical protein [Salinibacter ruber]
MPGVKKKEDKRGNTSIFNSLPIAIYYFFFSILQITNNLFFQLQIRVYYIIQLFY